MTIALAAALGALVGVIGPSHAAVLHDQQAALVERLESFDDHTRSESIWLRVQRETPWAYDAIATSPKTLDLVERVSVLATERHLRHCAEASKKVWLPWLRSRIKPSCAGKALRAHRDAAEGQALAAIAQAARTICRQSPTFNRTLAGVLAVSTVAPAEVDEAFIKLQPAAHHLEDELASAYARSRTRDCVESPMRP